MTISRLSDIAYIITQFPKSQYLNQIDIFDIILELISLFTLYNAITVHL